MFRKIFFILLLFFSYSICAIEKNDPLEAFLNSFDNLTAKFTQNVFDGNGKRIEKTEGNVYLQHKGKFHWAYEVPYLLKIISDGKSLWIYDEDLEQVIIRDMAGLVEQTPIGVILGNISLDKHFVVTYLENIDGLEWLLLRPHNVETQYKNIRIGFEKNKLRMMIVNDNLNNTTRIDFHDIKKNQDLSVNLFGFKITDDKDIDIIDEREPIKNNN